MFYNPGFTAYHWYFTKEEMEILRAKKIKIAAFMDHGKYILPDYILSYPYLERINYVLK
jgi:hypothetical protein